MIMIFGFLILFSGFMIGDDDDDDDDDEKLVID
jgi:hypothetical protein